MSSESWELPRYARLLCSDSGSLRKKRSPRSTSVIAVRSKDAAPCDRRCSLCTLSALAGLDAGPDLRRTNFLEFEWGDTKAAGCGAMRGHDDDLRGDLWRRGGRCPGHPKIAGLASAASHEGLTVGRRTLAVHRFLEHGRRCHTWLDARPKRRTPRLCSGLRGAPRSPPPSRPGKGGLRPPDEGTDLG